MGASFLDLLVGPVIDCFGFLASGATLYTFAQKRMLPMRISAITANVFFIAYGALGLVYPVLLLHLILLPLNIRRLSQQLADQTEAPREPVKKRHDVTLIEEWRRNRHRFSHAPQIPRQSILEMRLCLFLGRNGPYNQRALMGSLQPECLPSVRPMIFSILQ